MRCVKPPRGLSSGEAMLPEASTNAQTRLGTFGSVKCSESLPPRHGRAGPRPWPTWRTFWYDDRLARLVGPREELCSTLPLKDANISVRALILLR
jgi:hypothetical protein